MIEIQRQGPDDANDEHDGAVDSENDQRQVGEGLVDDDLRPVKAEISDPAGGAGDDDFEVGDFHDATILARRRAPINV